MIIIINNLLNLQTTYPIATNKSYQDFITDWLITDWIIRYYIVAFA